MKNIKKEYQFVKGNRIGTRVFLDKSELDEKSGDYILYFTDGTTAKSSQLGSSIVEIPEGHPGYEFLKTVNKDIIKSKDADGKEQYVPGPDYGKVTWKKRKIQAQKITNKNKSTEKDTKAAIKSTKPINKPPIVKNETEFLNNNDAVINLLEKAKKVNKVFKIDISIETIDKSLYKVLSDNYEDGTDKTIEYIISNINFGEIKKEMAKKIKQYYENKSNRKQDIHSTIQE